MRHALFANKVSIHRRSANVLVPAAVVTLLLALLANPADSIASTDRAAEADNSDRVVESDEARCRPAPSLSEHNQAQGRGNDDSNSWLTDGQKHGVVESVADAEFAEAGEIVREHKNDFLGTYLDHAQEALVLVSDPGRSERGKFAAQELRARTSRTNFRVEPGCNSRAELQAIIDDVMTEEFQEEWGVEGMGGTLDPATGTAHFKLSMNDAEVRRHLEETYGDLVSVSEVDGKVFVEQAGGKLNDVEPHYGGARIRVSTSEGIRNCTSGFAVDRRGGPRVMTTAGHCSTANGNIVRNWQNGPYGTIRGRSHPSGDSSRVEGRTYHRLVYTGGFDSEVQRIITGKRDTMSNGQNVCMSGGYTGFICSTVVNESFIFCSNGCRITYLTEGGFLERINRPGDSGSPYIGRRTGTNEANARGSHSGGVVCDLDDRCLYSAVIHIRDLESVLAVRIATQPGLEW